MLLGAHTSSFEETGLDVGRITDGVENLAGASGALLDAAPTLRTAQRHVLSDTDAPPGRSWALLLIAIAQIGAMSTWFSAAAVAPSLAADWHLSTAQLGLLTAAVSLASWQARSPLA